jgi:hypothetical protein
MYNVFAFEKQKKRSESLDAERRKWEKREALRKSISSKYHLNILEREPQLIHNYRKRMEDFLVQVKRE